MDWSIGSTHIEASSSPPPPFAHPPRRPTTSDLHRFLPHRFRVGCDEPPDVNRNFGSASELSVATSPATLYILGRLLVCVHPYFRIGSHVRPWDWDLAPSTTRGCGRGQVVPTRATSSRLSEKKHYLLWQSGRPSWTAVARLAPPLCRQCPTS